jgi:hypothetical protein
LQFLHSLLWHQQRLRSFGRAHTHAGKLTRQHGMLRIAEHRLDLHRAGLRVDAVQRVHDMAPVRMNRAIAEDQFDWDRSAVRALE